MQIHPTSKHHSRTTKSIVSNRMKSDIVRGDFPLKIKQNNREGSNLLSMLVEAANHTDTVPGNNDL